MTEAIASGGELPQSAAEPVVANAIGVSPVDWDTRLLARKAAEVGGNTILDLGTGTGFVAIYLALRGFDVEGADVNPAAIRCARENARVNGVDIEFRHSDLFESLERRYGLIAFNPPYGNTNSVGSTRLLEIAKSLLPKENYMVRTVGYRLIRRPRLRLLRRFLSECPDHLETGGRLLLLLHESELNLTAEYSTVIEEAHEELRLVLLELPQ